MERRAPEVIDVKMPRIVLLLVIVLNISTSIVCFAARPKSLKYDLGSMGKESAALRSRIDLVVSAVLRCDEKAIVGSVDQGVRWGVDGSKSREELLAELENPNGDMRCHLCGCKKRPKKNIRNAIQFALNHNLTIQIGYLTGDRNAAVAHMDWNGRTDPESKFGFNDPEFILKNGTWYLASVFTE